MFSLTVRDHVMIAHSLPRPAFGPAQGLHGATFVVELTVRAGALDANSTVMDIGEASGLLSAVLDGLRYRNLDEHPDFAGRLTTTEVLAQHIAVGSAEHLRRLGHLAEIEVTLRETPDAWASYTLALAGATGSDR
ncbi:6-carboxytetrahydropterin synthase [Sinomonas atrocyanea]|jgi:6-pyruvoyltetrahydropterin/6-carboxytetrahydropterin synthase|uniref:6-pyruvoyl trahydropterin synthase family protein n=1 Tax=Sinomonas atrocyanea TaxID=37927 RepID=UPI0027809A1C|nr:6-carboxytetrahydropterin synthase [Sinomonas atrocyanea]MDQ0261607.1 6-pyruvoyltetrahydropterin/6-carboxytetrahydropterin synthase [Sinomonas atrocyanea]MDR6621534.1 6-pyruvoyltetrahydropterin/6-carboxytetrahydropterin synthase [Sinomonas atrocyanea]